MDVWQITWFTLLTAALATAVMLPPGLLVAWVLARKRFRGRLLLDTLVSLPLVLPPVATGLILLTLFAPFGPVGRVLERAGVQVVFTWKAVVLAMTVMGLPLFVRTVRAGFEQVDRRFEAAAATLGAGPLRVFMTVTLPLARPAVIGGAVLGFARALAVAIYSLSEIGRTREAAGFVLICVAIAFAALWWSNRLAWTTEQAG